MPQNQPDETVAQILRRKLGSIKTAPLPAGALAWDDILDLPWAEVEAAKARRGRLQDDSKATFRQEVRQMNPDRFENLSSFLTRLEEANLSFQVARNRYDAVSVVVAVPGQRWEVDFLDDGDIEVERFVSSGQIDDESALEELFSKFAEPSETQTQSIESNGLVTR